MRKHKSGSPFFGILSIFLSLPLFSGSAWAKTPLPPKDDPKALRALKQVPGEYLISVPAHRGMTALGSARHRLDTQILGTFRTAGSRGRWVQRVKVLKEKSTSASLSALSGGGVEVQPNYIYWIHGIPSDPSFGQQWGLHNTGQNVNGIVGSLDADGDVPEAWDLVQGSSGVVVAVTDTGVDWNHPDLIHSMWTNPGEVLDGVDNDGNGYVDDLHGFNFFNQVSDPRDLDSHGTHVAGIIGAQANNGEGGAGVAAGVRIMAVRISGVATFATSASIAEGIAYAVDNGAKVINASWGGGADDPVINNAIDYANTQKVLFVAAAGNDATNNDTLPHYPSNGTSPNILSVAATDANDLLASFSNYGKETVDVGAPGVNIYSPVAEIHYSLPSTFAHKTEFNSPLGGVPPSYLRAGPSAVGDVMTVQSSTYGNTVEDSPARSYGINTDARLWTNFPINAPSDTVMVASITMNLATESNFDFFSLCGSFDKNKIDGYGYSYTGHSGGMKSFVISHINLTAMAEMGMNFGFCLDSDNSVSDDGVYLKSWAWDFAPITVTHGYDYYSGTSMAAPFVSGVAALLYSILPEAPADKIKELIMASVDPLPSLSAKVASGGRVNAQKAVQAAYAVSLASAPVVTPQTLDHQSITWQWIPIANANHYRVKDAATGTDLSGPLSSTTSWKQNGLAPNALRKVVVEVVGNYGDRRTSAPAEAVTLANPPVHLTVSPRPEEMVFLEWSANGNPPSTVYLLESSINHVDFDVLADSTERAIDVGPLIPGLTYTFRVTAKNAVGALSSPLVMDYNHMSQEVVGAAGGTASHYFTDNENVKVTVPPNAFASFVVFTFNKELNSNEAKVVGKSAIPFAPYKIYSIDTGGIQPSVKVDLDLDLGLPPETPVSDPKNTFLARYDSENSVWIPLPSQVTETGQIHTQTPHFSLFQVFVSTPQATSNNAVVFPNPYRTRENVGVPLSIAYLPANQTLGIYSMEGTHMGDFQADATGLFQWNIQPKEIPSGVYLVVIGRGSGAKTLKVVIE